MTREAGLDVFEFAVSNPYPTYLVALAVGEFDVLEAPAGAIEGVRFRLLAARGKGPLGKAMLQRTPPLLASLTRYVGGPYPYRKLDVVAVPNFSAGAMENVGLVTFRESRLLMDPNTASVHDRRHTASIMAHELSHMWFGNLVTMPWWDELWLNEAFATWMAHRVMVEVMPELQSDVDAVSGVSRVMGVDAARQARAIRQPIAHGGDVYNAFDGITYVKGAAVLRMFEAWLGEEVFREGIRSYLKANAHGLGTTADLMAALEEASGKPVGETMRLFLDQPGTPFLDIVPRCEKERVTLLVRQSRYLPAGSDAEQGEPWTVPICVRYQRDDRGIEESKIHCSLVAGRTDSVALPTDRCPAFIYPNADQAGYFRWNLPAEWLRALTERHRDALTAPEKVGLLYNVDALLEARKLAPEDYFAVIDGMAGERLRAVVEWLMGALHGLHEMVPDPDRAAFRKWARRLLDDDLGRLGLEKRPGEGTDPAMLRPLLLWALALVAADERVLDHAGRVTDRFLKNMSSVDSDAAAVALMTTAWSGDGDLWGRYREAFRRAPNPAAREALIAGLGSFRDPGLLRRSLELGLDGTVRSQDFYSLIWPSRGDPAARRVSWEWFEKNYERIVRMLGSKRVPGLPRVGSGFCEPEGRRRVEAFFSDPAHVQEGTARNLANTLEKIDRCIRHRAYLRDALVRYLRRR
jgi:alanyl aminopeptidase